MRDRYGQARGVHILEEYVRPVGATLFGRPVYDLDHTVTRLVLLGRVALEDGPCFSAGDELAQARKELAAVADAEGEGVGAGEEGLEVGADGGVEEDGFGPALAGA